LAKQLDHERMPGRDRFGNALIDHNSRPTAAVPSVSGPASWPQELLRWADSGHS
jgi:hypothetical protein